MRRRRGAVRGRATQNAEIDRLVGRLAFVATLKVARDIDLTGDVLIEVVRRRSPASCGAV